MAFSLWGPGQFWRGKVTTVSRPMSKDMKKENSPVSEDSMNNPVFLIHLIHLRDSR